MTLALRVLKANDVVCIVGSEVPVGDTSVVVTRVLRYTIVPDLDADRSGLFSMFFKTIILPLNHHRVITV